MKIFIDTANLDMIKDINSWGILDGVTTNPSLIAKEGVDVRTRVREIAEVNVKLPMCIETLKATKILSSEGIRVNVTLIFSPLQALLAAKAGAAFVSPFIGRLDDIGEHGIDLVSQIRTIFDNYGFDTEIIAASIRGPVHVLDAAMVGADIATIPYDTLKLMVKHPKTDEGIAKFIADYEKSKKS